MLTLNQEDLDQIKSQIYRLKDLQDKIDAEIYNLNPEYKLVKQFQSKLTDLIEDQCNTTKLTSMFQSPFMNTMMQTFLTHTGLEKNAMIQQIKSCNSFSTLGQVALKYMENIQTFMQSLDKLNLISGNDYLTQFITSTTSAFPSWTNFLNPSGLTLTASSTTNAEIKDEDKFNLRGIIQGFILLLKEHDKESYKKAVPIVKFIEKKIKGNTLLNNAIFI